MNIACFLIALYIFVDSIIVAKKASALHRHCQAVKYTLAFASSLYLFNRAWHGAGLVELLHGATICAFIWQDSFYRVIGWIEIHSPRLFALLSARLRLERRAR